MAADSDSDSYCDRLGSLLGELMCPLCGGYFRDPMVASCGHNFCHVCISRAWERSRDSFPCPVCRAASPEIRLRPNRQLRNAVGSAERLAARPRTRQAARTARKLLGRSMEELSLGSGHDGEPSRKQPPFESWRDRPIEGAPSMCPEHGEPLDLFCSQDQRPVCVKCWDLPQHRGHDFLPLRNGIQQYQKWIQAKQQKIVAEFQQLRQFLEEQERLLLAQLQKLDEELVKHQTERGRKLSEQISRLSELIRKLEGKCQKPVSEFQQDIRSTLSRCEEGQAQQPGEMAPELEERVRDFSQQTIVLSQSLRAFRGTLAAALVSQRGYSPANVTLDPDTAHPQLILSEDGKRVRWMQTWQSQSNTLERFDTLPCVLGREGFTSGRHCWEVRVGDGQYWAVGVARESLSRKGWISWNPEGGIWAVKWYFNDFWALTDPETPLPLRPPSRIRVCLDCDRGQVTFIDAGAETPIFAFPPGSLPGERIRPCLEVWDTDTELQLCP